jgi:simple sugar transport system ATP-binding protein
MTYALELRGIGKRFGDVQANRDVDLAVRAGTVHAIVGENGAGKTTLMHIAYGHTRADAGRILLKGEEVPRARHSPAESLRRGVGMVHQHFMLVGPMTVAENVALGNEQTDRWALDLARTEREVAELAGRFGFESDPRARIEDLSVGEQQRVEILKVLWRGCDVLILDEPTAVLTPPEVRELFGVLRKLVADGVTVVLITHKLDEVADIADRVTVMRRGAVVDELEGDVDVEAIANAMVGRPVLLRVDKRAARPGEVVLSVEGLRVRGRRGVQAVRDVAFDVRAGEIVAIAGVVGNGQSELLEAITGVRPLAAGSVTIRGIDASRATVRARHAAGVSHIPEDRQARGLVLDFDVAGNLILGRQREHATPLGLDSASIRDNAQRLIAAFDVRPPEPAAIARALSGGNQQKLVVAREVTRPSMKLLVCGQPTRGVDIGAIELIHRRIVAARDDGAAVLLVSAELGEIRALADRVLVMYRGTIVDALDAAALADAGATERLGRAMTGVRR